MFQVTPCDAAACHFDKTLLAPVLGLELFILLVSGGLFWWFSKKDKNLWKKWVILAIGIFIFEFFTSPMWNNFHMGAWAYVYRDVSWILTLGWTAMMYTVMQIVETHAPSMWPSWKKFLGVIGVLTLVVVPFESLLVSIGVRSYSPEVMDTFIGWRLGNVHVELFYYVPVFSTLVISFYKYWELFLDKAPVIPVRKVSWLRNLVLSIIGVVCYELVIEPMVVNVGFPSWSYFYRDLTFIMTGLWIFIIWGSLWMIDVFLIQLDLVKKFLCYVALVGIISLPMEAYFITTGMRMYGPSSVGNFSGYMVPGLNVAVEVAFAIPFYLALVTAFIKYWQIQFDSTQFLVAKGTPKKSKKKS